MNKSDNIRGNTHLNAGDSKCGKRRLGVTFSQLVFFAVIASAVRPAAAALGLADIPLFLSINMAPNLVLTLDDSLSMPWAAVPDSITGEHGYKRYKSSYYNALYFDPTVTYPPPPKYNGTTCPNADAPATCYPNSSFTAAPINGFDTSRGTVNLSTSYRATQSYNPNSTSQSFASTDSSGQAAYYYTFNSGNANCNGSKTDEDCYNKVTVSVAQQQNFANWYSYYRTRNLATVSAAMRAFANVDGNIRVAWQGLSTCTTFGTNCNGWGAPGLNKDNRIRRLNADNEAITGTVIVPVTHTATCSNVYFDRRSGDDEILIQGSGTGCSSFFSGITSGTQVIVSGAANNSYNGTYTVSSSNNSTSIRITQSFSNDYTAPSATLTWIENQTQTSITGYKTHKEVLFEWLSRFPSSGSTYTLKAAERAGEYFRGAITVSHPYAEDPQITDGMHYSCRRSVHLLMTDGGWCGDTGGNAVNVGDTNSTAVTVPVGPSGVSNYSWTPAAPYRDGQSNNLADIAFYYWAKDLQDGANGSENLANNLVPLNKDASGTADDKWKNPKNDPATWQHLNTYMVGLGLSDTLVAPYAVWGGSTFAGDYAKLALGTSCPVSTTSSSAASQFCWPYTQSGESCPPSTANQQKKVYDLWHAAISGRGKFFSSESPDDVVNAFNDILNDVANASSSSAALVANSTSIQTGTMIYQAKFNSQDWSGTILALPVQGDGSIGTALWDASKLIPSAASRKIFTYNGSAGKTFSNCNASLDAAQKAYLDKDGSGATDNKCAERLDWLSGNAVSGFRSRPATVLGDIVNSDPMYSKNEDFGYSELPGGTPGKTTYASYVAQKGSRMPAVYVGANDGMLHAFRADAGDTNSGKELFAYIPYGVYDHLSALTDTNYSHKYYVDGPPSVGDAYLSNAWKTVLAGGLGKGGKSIYALNITDPAAFGAANVMWEFADAADLGYTFSQPQIARLNNGVWAAIFGNGYNSTSDKAFLYIVDLSDGSLIKKIATNTSVANGLSTPYLYDSDNDKIIDAVYAGDLQGNLWKFDLSATAASSWGLGNGGVPLYTATNDSSQIQPITTQPVAGGHPQGGVLIYFGTGSYLTSTDVTDTNVQTFYAIWDNGSAGTVQRNQLQQQSIVWQGSKFGFELRETSQNSVNWGSQRGWRMDLVPPGGNGGERVISRALLKAGRVIFVTLIPATDPCLPGGDSWLMELDLLEGGGSVPSAFDFNNDNKFDNDDLLDSGRTASGLKSTVGITKTPTWLETETGDGPCIKEMSGSSGNIMSVKNRCDKTPSGSSQTREYWLQIQ